MGLLRVLSNRSFTSVDTVEEEIREYEKVNNPVINFLEEFKVENESNNQVYLKYATWCLDSGLKKLSKIQFGREICKYGYESRQKKIDGKVVRIFTKVTEG